MAETNGFFHGLGSAVAQRVVFGGVTLLLGVAGFLAKLEYNNIDERIDHNSSAMMRVSEEVRQIDVKYSSVRDEQIRRRGVLDKVDADIKWLWQESDKHRAGESALRELIQVNMKTVIDEARVLREKQMSNINKVERLEERAQRLETAITQLEQRVRWLESQLPVYRSEDQPTLQRRR